MASASISAHPANRRARGDIGVSAATQTENLQRRQRRHKAPFEVFAPKAPSAREPAAAPASDGLAASVEERLDLLWSELQKQMLELLSHGVAAPFQRRAFDKLDYSMKQYAKARRERADNMLNTQSAEPDAEELAAILNKIDRRIDELAEDRFKKLAGGKFLADAVDDDGAGMDVSRQAQARAE